MLGVVISIRITSMLLQVLHVRLLLLKLCLLLVLLLDHVLLLLSRQLLLSIGFLHGCSIHIEAIVHARRPATRNKQVSE